MRILFLISAALLLGSGCSTVTPTKEFCQNNPELVSKSAEVFEVPVEQWIWLEASIGREQLLRGISIALNHDEARSADTKRNLSRLFNEVQDQYLGFLQRLNTARSEMGPQDRLFYCREAAEPSGSFYVARDGIIRMKVFPLCTWENESVSLWRNYHLGKK